MCAEFTPDASAIINYGSSPTSLLLFVQLISLPSRIAHLYFVYCLFEILRRRLISVCNSIAFALSLADSSQPGHFPLSKWVCATSCDEFNFDF